MYTADRLAKIEQAATVKADRKKQVAASKAEVARQEFIAWAKPHGQLIGRILMAKGQRGFLSDIASKLRQRWMLTDKQIEVALKMIDAMANRSEADARSEYVGEIKQRIDFEAVILGVYETEGYYGHTDIIKMRDMDDNLLTWFASGYQSLIRGDRVSVRGTITKHNEYQGTKQTIINRCKIEKFEIVAADDIAQVETI